MYSIIVTCTTSGCRSCLTVEIAGSLTSGRVVDAARSDLLTRMRSAGWVLRGDVPTCAECESDEVELIPIPSDWRRGLDLS